MASPKPTHGRASRTTGSVLDEIAARRAADVTAELGDRDLRAIRRDAPEGPARRDVAGRLARPGSAPHRRDQAPLAIGRRARRGASRHRCPGARLPGWWRLDRSPCSSSPTGSAARWRTCGRPAQPPRCRCWPRSSSSMPDSCLCCGQPGRTPSCCWPLSIGPGSWPGSSRWPSKWGWSHSWRRTMRASRAPRSARAPGSSASTTATCARSGWTWSWPCACAPWCPDDRLVVAESGLRDAATVRRWRAAGIDAALVGEDLMRTGSDPVAVEARVATYVAAGSVPAPGVDPAADGRTPFVKICGVTEPSGLAAAMAGGADAIGLNFVPGTPRALDELEAAELIAAARAGDAPGNGPLLVGVFADRPAREVAAIAARLGLDAVQLHGHEKPGDLDRIPLPVLKVLHVPAAGEGGDATRADDDADRAPDPGLVDALVGEADQFLAKDNLQAILLDAATPGALGGTGRRAARALVHAIATRIPVILAGGLDAANVAQALIDIPAIGVDVSSGVEPRPRAGQPRGNQPGQVLAGRPAKDPLAVALFLKRAGAARLDRPTVPFGPQPVDTGLLEADAHGRWGVDRDFGGRFVPETLMAALLDLEAAYARIRSEPAFWAEFRELLARYVGRPTPVYRADRLAAEVERRAGRDARPPAPLPEARGSRPHRRPQDQQRSRPGAAHEEVGQAAGHRRDGGRPARRGHRHRVRPARARLRRVHGRGGHPSTGPQRAAHARARIRGARGDLGHGHAQGRRQRDDARLGHERRHDPLCARLGRGAAPVPDDRARPPAGHRRRGRGAGPHGRRPSAGHRHGLCRRRLECHRPAGTLHR